MNKQLIAGLFLLVAILGGYYFLNSRIDVGPVDGGGVMCTMEAKQCPDGSYVGRGGLNCEFAKCPDAKPASVDTSKDRGKLTGVVTLSPVCPVERMPPDPKCAPKPYVTSVYIVPLDRHTSLYQTLETSSDGKFTTELPPGRYELHVSNTNNSPYPRCEVVTIKMEGGKTTSGDIFCDTGIR